MDPSASESGSSLGRPPSPPRSFPSDGFESLGDDVIVEEETLSWYSPELWYPLRIGEVFKSRYQVLLKLGFGSVSTVWLSRDLQCVQSTPLIAVS